MGGRDLGDQLLDTEREQVDLRAEGVELVEQQLRELGVVVIETAGEGQTERLRERAREGDRAAPAALVIPVALAGDIAAETSG